jgi:hypothetical protein
MGEINKHKTEVLFIDNFLPSETFENIKAQMMGDNFPWFYLPFKTHAQDNNDIFDSQFTHTFYFGGKWNSPYMWAVEPILSILNPKEIVRIKANLTVPSTKVSTWGMHTDFNDPSITTGIFYLTECDGGTVFEGGKKVDSKPNRFAYFPADTHHSGETFTDAKARCVINFNLIL